MGMTYKLFCVNLHGSVRFGLASNKSRFGSGEVKSSGSVVSLTRGLRDRPRRADNVHRNNYGSADPNPARSLGGSRFSASIGSNGLTETKITTIGSRDAIVSNIIAPPINQLIKWVWQIKLNKHTGSILFTGLIGSDNLWKSNMPTSPWIVLDCFWKKILEWLIEVTHWHISARIKNKRKLFCLYVDILTS